MRKYTPANIKEIKIDIISSFCKLKDLIKNKVNTDNEAMFNNTIINGLLNNKSTLNSSCLVLIKDFSINIVVIIRIQKAEQNIHTL